MALSKIRRDSADVVTIAVVDAAKRWAAGTRVCVALSGGLDSTVLLHALKMLRAQQPDTWSLSAHHVHHGLSPNADRWAAHCESVCASLAVPLTMQRVSVDQHAGTGIEAAARAARFASLDSVNADVLVLAHHARDQAETLLLQLSRGAGPAGLASMPAISDRYERPLLTTPKSALAAYAEHFSLHWIEDESNLDDRFARNRMRNRVWPTLVAAFPAAETTLGRAAQHQAEAAQLLDELAQLDAAQCVLDNALQLSAFNVLSDARRANLLRFWLRCNDVDAPTTDRLREWLKQLRSAAAEQAIELRGALDSGGAAYSQNRRAIRVYRGQAYLCHEPQGWQPVPWNNETALQLGSERSSVGSINFAPSHSNDAIRTPRSGEHWQVRSRRDGDGIELTSRSGHVALKNVFQQASIAPWLRGTWPLLTCNNEIVSVISIATAKAFIVTSGETGVICEWKPAWLRASRS